MTTRSLLQRVERFDFSDLVEAQYNATGNASDLHITKNVTAQDPATEYWE